MTMPIAPTASKFAARVSLKMKYVINPIKRTNNESKYPEFSEFWALY